jgi:hypothetical protein
MMPEDTICQNKREEKGGRNKSKGDSHWFSIITVVSYSSCTFAVSQSLPSTTLLPSEMQKDDTSSWISALIGPITLKSGDLIKLDLPSG